MTQSLPEPTELQKEVQRKVGRSLLLFQQIELLMKVLLVNAKLTTTLSGGSTVHARAASVQKRSMGQLAGQFFEELLADAGEMEDPAEPIKEIRFTTRFRFELGPGVEPLRQYQEEFGAIIEERNDLVHHFLSRFNVGTDEGCAAAIEHLERQRERALKLHAHLKSVFDTMQETFKQMAAFANSDEGQRQFELMCLQSSRLVGHLAGAAQQLARADGWTLLSTAGQVLSREVPDELATIKTRYRQRTLKSLVIASEVFDVRDEPTKGGNFRTLYRIKSELLPAPLH